MSLPFFAYMLRCNDGSYYVGHTDDLERRVAEHQSGEIPGYTAQRRPLELIWFQEFEAREEAQEAESRIKKWSRRKKEALAHQDWEALRIAARKNGQRSNR